MYLRFSSRSSSRAVHSRIAAVTTASVVAIASATGAVAQEPAAADQLPELVVETTKQSKAAKKKPTSEPQAPVTLDTSPAADPEAPVVFSANRTPTDAAKVGSSVSVITEKDIDAQSKTFLQDYLQQVPGVSISTTGGFGQTTTLRMRGFNQNYVKVLVDGMDISDPSGTQTAAAFEHLLVGDMAQIEVLKGSQSTLYGGDAVAGVISIDSKYATRPGYFQSGGTEYGTFNSFRGAYSAGYAAQNGSNIAFTVQGLDTDGISAAAAGTEDDAYRNMTFSGRGEYRVSEEMTVFFAGRAFQSHTEFDDGFFGVDAFDFSDYQQQAGRVGANISLFGGQFVNTIAIQGMELQRDFSYGSWFDGERVKGEYRGVLSFNKQLALVAGADWERNGALSSGDPVHHEVEIVSPYAQLIVEPIAGLTLTGGARIDDHSAFGQFDTHRLTAAYLIESTATKFHASYGTGFRAPSLNELFGPFGGNPDLHPETSESWDAGVEQGFMNGLFGVGATYFSIDVTDQIGFVSVFPGPCPPCGFYQQLPGVTATDGVELTVFAKLTQATIVNAAYTYSRSKEPDGTRLEALPRHSFVIGVTAQPTERLSLNVTGQYVADTVDTTGFPAADVPVDDYFLLSAKVGYEVLPGAIAYVRGENLLDQDYTTVINYANPGLAVYGGVQFALPAN